MVVGIIINWVNLEGSRPYIYRNESISRLEADPCALKVADYLFGQ
jgi:hypothetical protein